MQPGCNNGVAPDVTRDETRNTFDEDRLTFGEAGSSSEAKRWHSTLRSREYRRRKKLGLQTCTIRVAPKRVTKLIEPGHNLPPLSVVRRRRDRGGRQGARLADKVTVAMEAVGRLPTVWQVPENALSQNVARSVAVETDAPGA